MGCSPWGHKESDTTELLSTLLSSYHILAREGNGALLQYSCLENPMDRGAWRATAHGVAQLDRTEAPKQQQEQASEAPGSSKV